MYFSNKFSTCIYSFIYLYVCLAQVVKPPPSITIPGQGTIAGTEVKKARVQKIIAYYGIPYAQPPLVNLRFAPPVTDPLPKVVNNSGYLPGCPQSEKDYKESERPFFQVISDLKFGDFGEDCLYLNIFVPADSRPQSEFATIIWFHPGSFVTGTPAIWNPHTLVYRYRVIIVTVAWRLNVLGFFTTMDSEASGNYGLLDQQAAMLWVKKHIHLFGGNPENICLMGYGAGATSIGLHMINSISKGLFNKAIVMSGDFLSPSVVKLPEDYKEQIEAIIPKHCDRRPTSKLVECLRNTNAKWLVEQSAQIDWRPLLDSGLGNVSFLQDLPINYFQKGDYNQIPLLTGYTHMEQVLDIDGLTNLTDFSSSKLKEVISKILYDDIMQQYNGTDEASCIYNHVMEAATFFYNPARPIKNLEQFRGIIANFITEKKVASATYLQATYLTKENSTYVYRFHIKLSTKAARVPLPDWVTVPHLYDLIYVWGVPYWENTSIDWDIRDRKFSDTVMSLWTTFAKSSDPSENNIYPIDWAPFSEDNPGIMIIDDTFNMNNSNNLNYKAFEFWNDYYPKLKEMAVKCCHLAGSAENLRNNWIYLLVLLLNIFIYIF